jgi:hypothetical protein
MYRHTQVGRFVIGLNFVIALAMIAVALLARQVSAALIAGVVILAGIHFSTLTVEVRDGVLRFRFGPGGWGKRIPLSEIVDAAATTSSWIEGIGIRITMRGMLYNVATGPAVELRLRSGKRFRLGTDEPEALLRALGAPPPSQP